MLCLPIYFIIEFRKCANGQGFWLLNGLLVENETGGEKLKKKSGKYRKGVEKTDGENDLERGGSLCKYSWKLGGKGKGFLAPFFFNFPLFFVHWGLCVCPWPFWRSPRNSVHLLYICVHKNCKSELKPCWCLCSDTDISLHNI